MKPRESRRIINISSLAGRCGSYGHINYASSKAGIIGLTKSASRVLGTYNITVNAILPGLVEGTYLSDRMNEDAKKTTLSRILLNRLGKPEDIAFAAAFLASEEAA